MRAVGLLKIWVINCLLFYLPPKSLTEICRTAKTKSVVRWHCGDCLGYAFCLLKFYYIETPLSDLHSLICMSSYRDTGACEAETAFTKCLGNHQLFPVSFWVRLGPCNKLSSEMWAEPNLGAEEAKNPECVFHSLLPCHSGFGGLPRTRPLNQRRAAPFFHCLCPLLSYFGMSFSWTLDLLNWPA